MKKNIAIVVLIISSISFLVFSYTQRLEADSNRFQAIQLQIKVEELRVELVQCQENAKVQAMLALEANVEAQRLKEIAESKK
jgi:competence protein ComGF